MAAEEEEEEVVVAVVVAGARVRCTSQKPRRGRRTRTKLTPALEPVGRGLVCARNVSVGAAPVHSTSVLVGFQVARSFRGFLGRRI